MTTSEFTPTTGKEKAERYRKIRQSYIDDLSLLDEYPKLSLVTKRSAIAATKKNIDQFDESLLKDIIKELEFIKDRGFIEDLFSVLELVQDSVNKIRY